ncbi:coiled-coil domain-containing protein 34 [Diachasma alloeum]|uniref:coiled-coil domain-containing protein 34 n=1 Tax=Diachasma alloeum TaxID=454923 RepID=UPI000738177B|nr:coiled-coil domain-containing protein 34 [Diachasma alloeum]
MTHLGDFDDYDFDYSTVNSINDRHSKPEEMRFINPAIYVEPLKTDQGESIKSRRKVSGKIIHETSGDGAEFSVGLPQLSLNDNPQMLNACRSQSTMSSVTPSLTSVSQGKSTARVERRCIIDEGSDESLESPEIIQRYTTNGERVQISASLSTSNLSAREYSSRVSLPRQLAHEEWVQKKKLESLRLKKKSEKIELEKKAEEERLSREREERERREHENFLVWTRRKNQEEAKKRKLAEKERELAEKLKQIEEKAAVAKEICLLQWSLNKNKAQKVQKEEQDRKLRQLEEEKKKRLEESVKAFEEWREKSKNTPRPATQGLLPHQKAKPAYVNPIPWISEDPTPELLKNPHEFTRNMRRNEIQH